ncbi:putative mit domain-containing protein [Erysiphe neolycopersici]|uniref:Putative mit domain-containing protein n=1 Tax=Erysiphe neolycopersici TaxID=212602 RepID=A0A420I5D7_9PEZI|nr:putative mit domain-containing protein [Erysiphe neolycopersici]
MNPVISPPTSRTPSSASRPVDYTGKSWESSSFRLSNSVKEESQAIPKSESIFNPTSELNVTNVDSHHEVMSRLGGLSRHRTSSSAGGSQHSIRPSKHPSQKAMLSKALQKANTAVLLDNAQNFEVAKQAYSEACALLERVMTRSSGDDDRKKLEAIRNTYTSRISEIEKISSPIAGTHGKALPARPDFGMQMSNTSNLMDPDEEEEEEDKEYASSSSSLSSAMHAPITTNNQKLSTPHQSKPIFISQLPPRRESLHQQTLDTLQHMNGLDRGRSQRKKISKDFTEDRDTSGAESHITLSNYSPKRSLSPNKLVDFSSQQKYSLPEDLGSDTSNFSYLESHSRMLSGDSLSWLDTIDESGRSATSSIPSRTSSVKFPGKIIRATNPGPDAEFDAALDAAVEAAYDETFMLSEDHKNDIATKLGYADEKTSKDLLLSDSEDNDEQLDHKVERMSLTQPQESDFIDDHDLDYFEEDEQMLEEITKDYIIDDFEFGLQSKSILPRESDSSGFSERTWASSIASNPTTASTITSTTSRARTSSQAPPPFLKLNIPSESSPSPPLPTPHQELPSPPSPRYYSNQNFSLLEPISPVTQNQRYSNYTELLLENESKSATEFSEISSSMMKQARSSNHGTTNLTYINLEESTQTRPQKSNSSSHRPPMLQLPIKKMSSSEDTSSSEILPGLSSFSLQNTTTTTSSSSSSSNDTTELQNYQSFGFSAPPPPPTTKTSLRKNFSSSSLRNLRKRHVTVPNYEGGSDISPGTPLNTPHRGRIDEGRFQSAISSFPTSVSMSFREKQSGSQPGSVYLLNTDIQNPDSPLPLSSPDGRSPISLEPCPNECFLRPFWLMRALYNTITHPKGGYLSNKLFVPSDAWRVKGVKLKNIEDKISNCDVLTAALSKMSRIDSLEVDEMLDEMQKLEDILEQVQISLSKRLGNEVGPPYGTSGGQRESGIDGDSENNNNPSTIKSGGTSSKSSFSWRRLRSKNSGVGLSQNYANKQNMEGKKDSFKMPSLPMTSNSTMKTRFSRKDPSQINFTGPNANYMSALARLFDAAQIIDHVGRQIEDPGLRRANKTLVGLELSARHAAEFFSSYICRFVLNDIGLLLDKFVKKGGEWVLE